MTNKTTKTNNEQRKKSLAEQMWLHYYNNTLLKEGLINERDYRRMKNSINTRKSSERER